MEVGDHLEYQEYLDNDHITQDLIDIEIASPENENPNIANEHLLSQYFTTPVELPEFYLLSDDTFTTAEIAYKASMVGFFMVYGHQSMMAHMLSGIAVSMFTTCMYNAFEESSYAKTVANTILKIESGYLKNYSMKLLTDSMSQPDSVVSKALSSIFPSSLNNYFVKKIAAPVLLNLTSSFMIESFNFLQNELFVDKMSNGALKLESTPFLTYRGPITIFKRVVKNCIGDILYENAATNDLPYGFYKLGFKTTGHFLANLPMSFHYNGLSFTTAGKTFGHSFAKNSGEYIFNHIFRNNYLQTLISGTQIDKITSTIMGTVFYINSKLLTQDR